MPEMQLHSPTRRGLCLVMLVLALLGMPVFTRAAEMEARAETTVPVLCKQLASRDFQERVAAQRSLTQLAVRVPEELAEAYPDADPETRERLLQLLEGVFLAHADERGDRAERALVAISDYGSPTAQAMLIGNGRLRESRAKLAIERLGGQLTYSHPANNALATAPLVGVGFGDAADLKTILIPEDWRGTADDLWHLERLEHHQNLTLFNIRGSKISNDDLLPLAGRLVGLRIEERGACLGIQAVAGSPHAQVSEVVKDSAAEAAGLQRLDEIETLNQLPVRNFSHLVELLTEYRPGDVVTLQVRRNAEVLQVPVRLASWKTVLRREMQAVTPPTPFPGPLGLGRPLPPEKPEQIQNYLRPDLDDN